MTTKKIYNVSNKEMLRIINETIGEFDFLEMNKLKEEEDYSSLVNSRDFQTKLLNDLVLWDKTKIVDWQQDSAYSNIEELDLDYDETINYHYGADFNYIYNGKKIPLAIYVEGNRVSFESEGAYRMQTQTNPAEYPQISKINYGESDITLFTGDGEEIDISWINNNPKLIEKIAGNIVDLP